ncbi:lysylphosphatidylglycerol synthase transmembrane domain-containing protein [Xanthomonas axonopodis]
MKRRLMAALRVVTGLGLLMVLLIKMDLGARLVGWSTRIDQGPALSGMLLIFAMAACRAWRWNIILGNLGTAFELRVLCRVYGASLFLGMVTPGKVGEAMRLWFARGQVGGRLPTAFYSVFLDKIFDVAPTLLIVVLFCLWLGQQAVPGGSAVLLGSVFVLLLLTAVIARPERLRAVAGRMLQRVLRKGGPMGMDVGAAPMQPISQRTIAASLGISLLTHVVVLCQAALFAQAVGIELPPLMLYGAIALGAVIAALPISIGGLGSREVTLIVVLQQLGVDRGAAMDFSILVLLSYLLLTAVSLAAYCLQPVKLGEIMTDLRPNRPRAGV